MAGIQHLLSDSPGKPLMGSCAKKCEPHDHATRPCDAAELKAILQEASYDYIIIFPSGNAYYWKGHNPDIYGHFTNLILFDCPNYVAYSHNLLPRQLHMMNKGVNRAFGLVPAYQLRNGPLLLRKHVRRRRDEQQPDEQQRDEQQPDKQQPDEQQPDPDEQRRDEQWQDQQDERRPLPIKPIALSPQGTRCHEMND